MQKEVTFLLGKTKRIYTYQEIRIKYEPTLVTDKIFDQQSGNKWTGWLKQLTAEVGFRNIKYKKKSRIDDKKFTIFKENSNNASIKINDTSSRITYINEKPEKSEYYYIKKVNFRQSYV